MVRHFWGALINEKSAGWRTHFADYSFSNSPQGETEQAELIGVLEPPNNALKNLRDSPLTQILLVGFTIVFFIQTLKFRYNKLLI
jgi:hypothetical protein